MEINSSKADLVGAHGGNYATAVNQIPESLEPVSTAAVPDTNGYLPMYYGVVETSDTVANNGEYILTATKTTEKIIQQEVRVKMLTLLNLSHLIYSSK